MFNSPAASHTSEESIADPTWVLRDLWEQMELLRVVVDVGNDMLALGHFSQGESTKTMTWGLELQPQGLVGKPCLLSESQL